MLPADAPAPALNPAVNPAPDVTPEAGIGINPACILHAVSSSCGRGLPRSLLLRRIPRQAFLVKKYLDGAAASKICDKEQSTTFLGHSEVFRIPGDPSHTGSYSQHGPSIFPAPGRRSNNMKVWFFNLEERLENRLEIAGFG